MLPETLAQSFAREIDRAVDARSRMAIAERSAKSAVVFAELLHLRRDIPELQVMLAMVNEKLDAGLTSAKQLNKQSRPTSNNCPPGLSKRFPKAIRIKMSIKFLGLVQRATIVL